MNKRSLEELVSLREHAWPLVQGWIATASNPVEVLDAEPAQRIDALVALQVTTRSPMGAVVYESGGLLVDGGWLRVLGAGCARLPRSIPGWNARAVGASPDGPPPLLLVGDDVLGGFFAINGGALEGKPGAVHYLAPDTLAWEELFTSYSDFLSFAFTGDLEGFYADWRWPGCREEAAALGGEKAWMFYPFLWAAGPPVAERTRGPVDVLECWELLQRFRAGG